MDEMELPDDVDIGEPPQRQEPGRVGVYDFGQQPPPPGSAPYRPPQQVPMQQQPMTPMDQLLGLAQRGNRGAARAYIAALQQQQHTDYNARVQRELYDAKLTQAEQLEMARMEQAKNAIDSNPIYNDADRAELKAYVDMRLDPFKARASKQQALYYEMRTRMMADQHAQMEAMNQEAGKFRAKTLNDRVAWVTSVDPQTGQKRNIQMIERKPGEWHPLIEKEQKPEAQATQHPLDDPKQQAAILKSVIAAASRPGKDGTAGDPSKGLAEFAKLMEAHEEAKKPTVGSRVKDILKMFAGGQKNPQAEVQAEQVAGVAQQIAAENPAKQEPVSVLLALQRKYQGNAGGMTPEDRKAFEEAMAAVQQ